MGGRTRRESSAAGRSTRRQKALAATGDARQSPDTQPVRRDEAAAPREARRPGLALTSDDWLHLFDATHAIWFVLDEVGIVREANVTACESLGASRRFLIGTALRMWVAEEYRSRLLEHMRSARRTTDVVEADVTLKGAGRGALSVRLRTRRVIVGADILFPTLAVDLGDEEMFRRALETAERQRDLADRERRTAIEAESTKDQLIAMVSHELRNPLSPALIAATGLAEWKALPGQARQMAEVIKRNIELEARLIDDLLDIARTTRGTLTLTLATVDVHAIVREAADTCAPAAQARGIAIILSLAAVSHHARADDARLKQVFWNLISNAVKFSDHGGHVQVRSASSVDGVLTVTVHDTGAGMDEETIQRLFKPFDSPERPSGQRAGLGLGLTIARGIIEAHQGTIWASSSGRGYGSTFEVELPTAAPDTLDPTPRAQPRGGEPRDRERPPTRVLIVEDHEDTGALMMMFLTQHGFDAVLVQTRKDALARLDESWDVVLSDIGLGDGTGLDVGRHCRELQRPPALLVALSGFGAERDLAASREAGFHRHLVKPVDLDELLRLLEESA